MHFYGQTAAVAALVAGAKVQATGADSVRPHVRLRVRERPAHQAGIWLSAAHDACGIHARRRPRVAFHLV